MTHEETTEMCFLAICLVAAPDQAVEMLKYELREIDRSPEMRKCLTTVLFHFNHHEIIDIDYIVRRLERSKSELNREFGEILGWAKRRRDARCYVEERDRRFSWRRDARCYVEERDRRFSWRR